MSSARRMPPEAILDLIDDALTLVDANDARALAGAIADAGVQLRAAEQHPHDRDVVLGLRYTAAYIAYFAGHSGFAPACSLADALDALTSRLLVRARVAPAEWARVQAHHDEATRGLGMRASW